MKFELIFSLKTHRGTGVRRWFVVPGKRFASQSEADIEAIAVWSECDGEFDVTYREVSR